MPLEKNSGQALVETLVMTGVALVAVALTGLIFWQQFKRTMCLYTLFQSTHSRLVGEHMTMRWKGVQFSDSKETLRGVLECEHGRETVELPYLETAKW